MGQPFGGSVPNSCMHTIVAESAIVAHAWGTRSVAAGRRAPVYSWQRWWRSLGAPGSGSATRGRRPIQPAWPRPVARAPRMVARRTRRRCDRAACSGARVPLLGVPPNNAFQRDWLNRRDFQIWCGSASVRSITHLQPAAERWRWNGTVYAQFFPLCLVVYNNRIGV